MKLKQLSIYVKIYLIVFGLIGVGMTIGYFQSKALNQTVVGLKELGDVYYEIRLLATNTLDTQRQMTILSRDIILETNPQKLEKLLVAFEKPKAEQMEFLEKIDKLGGPEEKQLVAEFKKEREIWQAYIVESNKLGAQNKNEEATKILFETAQPHLVKMREHLNKIKEIATNAANKVQKDLEHNASDTNRNLSIFGLIAIFASLLVSYFVIRSLKTSIQRIIESLNSSSQQVASASAQIASSSQQLSQAATEQASSLEETASSLEEISTMIAKSADSASTTESSSAESQSKAEEGRKAVELMLSSMNEISQSNQAIMSQVNQSNEEMTEIVRVIQEIGNKTKVINEIVFQTKLLSFNASVEAARAGEHGKGFAVVAEEVGNLAQMSGNAAKEITEMLDSSIGKVEAIVKNTKSKVEGLVEQGKEKVESGVNVARQCSTVLEEIVQNTSKVTGLAQEISSASKEQSQGVGEINKAMSQLDSVTQQNSATSEEAASAAEELSAQAETLKSVVDDLVLTLEGSSNKTVSVSHEPKDKKHSARSTPNNIVQLKTPKKISSPVPTSFKAASGDSTPGRDDDGFHDV